MIRVLTFDNQRFEGLTATAILRQMRDTQWGVPQPKREWKLDVADRVEQMTGERPRLTAVAFLHDLQRLKLLTIEYPSSSGTAGDATMTFSPPASSEAV